MRHSAQLERARRRRLTALEAEIAAGADASFVQHDRRRRCSPRHGARCVIFGLRIVDVSCDTMRVIFAIRGKRLVAAASGSFRRSSGFSPCRHAREASRKLAARARLCRRLRDRYRTSASRSSRRSRSACHGAHRDQASRRRDRRSAAGAGPRRHRLRRASAATVPWRFSTRWCSAAVLVDVVMRRFVTVDDKDAFVTRAKSRRCSSDPARPCIAASRLATRRSADALDAKAQLPSAPNRLELALSRSAESRSAVAVESPGGSEPRSSLRHPHHGDAHRRIMPSAMTCAVLRPIVHERRSSLARKNSTMKRSTPASTHHTPNSQPSACLWSRIRHRIANITKPSTHLEQLRRIRPRSPRCGSVPGGNATWNASHHARRRSTAARRRETRRREARCTACRSRRRPPSSPCGRPRSPRRSRSRRRRRSARTTASCSGS